jgi:hypothetical protein
LQRLGPSPEAAVAEIRREIEEAFDRPAWPRRIRGNRVSVAVRRPDDDDRAGGVLGHLGGDRPHR